MKYLYWNFQTSRDPGDLVISGVGVREEMRPVTIERPEGTGDYLLMYFYDPVLIGVGGRIEKHEAGTLMLWDRGEGHWYGSPGKRWCHSWLHFHGGICAGFLKKCGIEVNRHFKLRDNEMLEEYLIKIHREVTGYNSAEMLQLYWKSLIMELGRAKTALFEPEPPEKLAAVKEYLQMEPSGRDTVEDLAKMAGMSVPNFCALFSRWFKISPGQCRLRARMEKACFFLRYDSYTVKEVGQLVGYDDPYQFSRIFRKHTGVSPSRWRGKYLRKDFSG